MEVLVTGGAGYLGSVLCERLLDAGYEVTVVDNLAYGQNSLFHLCADPRFQFVQGDVADPALAGPLVQESDIVVHFAAETHVDRSLQDAGAFINTDVYGSFVLLDAARKAGACGNANGMRRDVLECFVLETLKDHLMHPDLVKEFITAFHAELNAESCNRAQLENQTRKELADVDRRLDGLIEAIVEGFRSVNLRTNLIVCQLRNASLKESSRRQNPVFPFSTQTWQCCIAARSQS